MAENVLWDDSGTNFCKNCLSVSECSDGFANNLITVCIFYTLDLMLPNMASIFSIIQLLLLFLIRIVSRATRISFAWSLPITFFFPRGVVWMKGGDGRNQVIASFLRKKKYQILEEKSKSQS